MSASEQLTPPNQLAIVAQAGQEDSRTVGGTKRFYPKTHANYWKPKLEHRTYSHDGKMCEVPEWSVGIQFKCNRRSFDLETANKEEAAVKARDIYLSLVAKGWSDTLAELAPQPETPVNVTQGNPTVGEFLAEVERTSTLKPKTFHRYAQYFRMMAAQIQRVKSDRSRYNYRTGGLTNWHERVDAIPLAAITPAAVADWKIAYLKRAGSDPRRRLEVSRSFNSALRHCKSLFCVGKTVTARVLQTLRWARFVHWKPLSKASRSAPLSWKPTSPMPTSEARNSKPKSALPLSTRSVTSI